MGIVGGVFGHAGYSYFRSGYQVPGRGVVSSARTQPITLPSPAGPQHPQLGQKLARDVLQFAPWGVVKLDFISTECTTPDIAGASLTTVLTDLLNEPDFAKAATGAQTGMGRRYALAGLALLGGAFFSSLAGAMLMKGGVTPLELAATGLGLVVSGGAVIAASARSRQTAEAQLPLPFGFGLAIHLDGAGLLFLDRTHDAEGRVITQAYWDDAHIVGPKIADIVDDRYPLKPFDQVWSDRELQASR